MAKSPSEIALLSLERTAAKDLDGLGALMDENIVMRFPFAPPGIPNSSTGKQASLEMTAGVFSMLEYLRFIDLQAFQTDDPELVFVTGRSEAKAANGNAYGNRYVFRIRVRDGRVVEHEEYFNPLPVIAAFG